MENQSRNTHPMIIVAATTLTIASLAAIASFAGWIPSSNSAAPAAQVAVAPAPAATPTPEPVIAKPAAPVAEPASGDVGADDAVMRRHGARQEIEIAAVAGQRMDADQDPRIARIPPFRI